MNYLSIIIRKQCRGCWWSDDLRNQNISDNDSFLPDCPGLSTNTAKIWHYGDVIMGAIASLITSVSIVCSTVWSGADQRKHQSCASLAFVRGIRWWTVDSPHKATVTRKMFSFVDIIMETCWCQASPLPQIFSIYSAVWVAQILLYNIGVCHFQTSLTERVQLQ